MEGTTKLLCYQNIILGGKESLKAPFSDISNSTLHCMTLCILV